MKKLILFVSLCLLIGTTFGQIPNSSFESWNSTSYDEPNGFETGNHESADIGLTPVTRVNGVNGYAVRMQTLVSNNGDTAQAYIANGDPGSGKGGVPFAEQPTAITGYYRYQLQGNDTAIFLVMFKFNGQILSSNIFKIRGTGTQNTFTTFSFPISLGFTPDSVIIAAASSNLIDNVGVQNGSFLELDGLAFTGANTAVDNGNFENWSTHTTDFLNDWETYGEGITKTTDSYDGTYAISLTTSDYGNGNIGNSGMTSGHNTNNGPVGGMPYTETTDTLIGYYKYATSASDSASVNVGLLKNSNYVGGYGKLLPAASVYTYFEIPISSFTAPDTMRIDINSSKWPTSQSSAGSTLILDHLQLKSAIAAGIRNPFAKKESVFAYPNPANDLLHIRLTNNISDNVIVEVYDLSGKLVIRENKSVADNNIDLQIASLASGKYIYRVYNKGVKFENSFSKE